MFIMLGTLYIDQDTRTLLCSPVLIKLYISHQSAIADPGFTDSFGHLKLFICISLFLPKGLKGIKKCVLRQLLVHCTLSQFQILKRSTLIDLQMEHKTTTDQTNRLVNSVVRMKEAKDNSADLPANKEVQTRAEPKKKPQVGVK